MRDTYQIFVSCAGIAVGAAFVWFVVRWFSPRPETGDANRVVRWVLYNFSSFGRGNRIQQSSRWEKALYGSALLLTVAGVVLVLSPFARFLANLENYSHFEASVGTEVFRSFGGLILILVGHFLMNWAVRGWGGVGIVPAPDGTRKQLMASANRSAAPTGNLAWDIEAVRQVESRQPEKPSGDQSSSSSSSSSGSASTAQAG